MRNQKIAIVSNEISKEKELAYSLKRFIEAINRIYFNNKFQVFLARNISKANINIIKDCNIIIYYLGGKPGYKKEINYSEEFMKFVSNPILPISNIKTAQKFPQIIILSPEEKNGLVYEEGINPISYFCHYYSNNTDQNCYLKCPQDFNISSVKELIKGKKWENPFININEILNTLNRKIKKIGLDNFYKNLSQNDPEFIGKFSDFESERHKKYHDSADDIRKIRIQRYVEFSIANIHSLSGGSQKKRILWIENNPKREYVKKFKVLDDIRFIEEYFPYEFLLVDSDEELKNLYNQLTNKKKNSFKFKIVEGEKNNEDYKEEVCLNIKNKNVKPDLILIDLYLSSDNLKINGKDFLKLFVEIMPEVPAFILSASEDYERIRSTLELGANYFIFKKYTMSIPFYFEYYHYIIGPLITLFTKEEIKKNLIGNIRYWKIKKELLWFGDKCYHMVNHSFTHINNDWKLLNQFLFPLLKEKQLNDSLQEDLYCLIMATWLHDIGHKGNDRHGEPHDIRPYHSVISSELILKKPSLFGIMKDKKEENKNVNNRPIMYLLNKGKNLSKVDKIALLCAYHIGKAPLTKDHYIKSLVNKNIPIDFFKEVNKIGPDQVIAFNDCYDSSWLKEMASILRFIDDIEKEKRRVGDIKEKNLKSTVIEQDIKFELINLKRKYEIILGILKRRLNNSDLTNFKNLFFKKPEKEFLKAFKEMDAKKISNLEKKQHDFIYNYNLNKKNIFHEYYLVFNYMGFLLKQKIHFDLHNCIDNVEIEHLDKEKKYIIKIVYHVNKRERYLNNAQKMIHKSIKKHIYQEAKKEIYSETRWLENFLKEYNVTEIECAIKYKNNIEKTRSIWKNT